MSAFTDRNAPGGVQASLPQVRTLEALINDVARLDNRIRRLSFQLEKHKNDGAGVPEATLHQSLQHIIRQAEQLANDAHRDLAPVKQSATDALNLAERSARLKDLQEHESNNIRHTSQAERQQNQAGNAAAVEANQRITALLQQLAQAVDTAVMSCSKIEAPEGRVDIASLVIDLKAQVAHVQSLTANDTLDFTQWSLVNAQCVAVTNIQPTRFDTQESVLVAGRMLPENMNTFFNEEVPNDYDAVARIRANPVLLIGVLSDVWNYPPTLRMPNGTSVQNENLRHKPAQIFIKNVNTGDWAAQVNASIAYDPQGYRHTRMPEFTGRISAVGAKQAARTTLRDDHQGFQIDEALIFGLYEGTDRTGHKHIYVGVHPRHDIPATAGIGHFLSGIHFYVAGINFIPLNRAGNTTAQDSLLAQGAVTQIIITNIQDNRAALMDDLYVNGSLFVNTIKDLEFRDKLVTDVERNELRLGDLEKPRNLHFHSESRPIVRHGETGGKHPIAYTTDIVQSVYWQRDVAVAVKTLAELQALTVYEIDNQTVEPGTAGANIVPGVYLQDTSQPNPAGHIFQDGDVALVKEASTERVTDGTLNVRNVVIEDPTPFTTSQISGFDVGPLYGQLDIEYVTLAALDDNPPVDVHPDFGPAVPGRRFWRVRRVTADGRVTLGPVDHLTLIELFAYTIPGYYVFNNGTWSLLSLINIPRTFDGIIKHATYEWAGPVSAIQRDPAHVPYFVESFIRWTPRFENHNLYEEALEHWTYTTLPFAMVRPAGEQDRIDDAIKELALVQTDYAEHHSVMDLRLPGRETVQVANPSYMQNRPWTGRALIDGGSLLGPVPMYESWLVDGGDYTNGNSLSSEAPWVPPANHFGNAIMRQWHGAYGKMPEQIDDSRGVWRTFAYMLRWVQYLNPARDELYISDGKEALKRFIPFDNYLHPNKRVIQNIERDGAELVISGTDFTEPGVPVLFEERI